MIFGAVENAIIAHLKAASAADVLGYTLKEVDSLPPDVDSNLPVYVKRFPAAWTVWTGWRHLGQQGDNTDLVEGRFNLVVGATSQRSNKASRHGVVGEVGVYQLAMDLPALLSGQTFGLPISGLAIGDCSALMPAAAEAQMKASLFGIALTCRAEIAANAPFPLVTPAIGDFLKFAVGWDVPPHTGAADQADLIQPPQDT